MAGMPVSGPGKFSQRTDKQPMQSLNNADYGEQKAYKQLQQDAPMASQPSVPAGQGMDFSSLFGNAASRVIPLGQESGMPNTPVTDGAALGPGAGPEALGLGPADAQTAAKLQAWLPALEFMANKPDSSSAARALVRRLKAQGG
jgi:hypothetical protein